MWSLTHFDDILNKMKGLQEPTVQTSTGGSCMCNQAQQEKGTFQRLEIYKHDSAPLRLRLRLRFQSCTQDRKDQSRIIKMAEVHPT